MRTSRACFAAILIGLGLWELLRGDFGPVWEPVPDLPARDALVYLTAAVAIACGAGLVWPRVAKRAALVLVGYLALFVAFRVRDIVRAPGAFGSWDGCAETLAIAAAALILHGQVRAGRALWGLCLIPFALAHVIYPNETAQLVPSWLPAHLPIAYVTGAAFAAAGVAILVGVAAPLAAALSAVQIAGFTLLVWVPIVAKGATSHFVWSETVLSAALAAAGWVVADSYRPATWRGDETR
jgi:uncharacterized membrane protein